MSNFLQPPPPTGGRRNLKKNQACLQCRKGKMKCDAAQPHCTNCYKAWQLLFETPGVIPETLPEKPSCDYDPVEGLIFTPEVISDPLQRAKVIQEQIAQLRGKLKDAQDELQPSSSSSSSLKRSATSALRKSVKKRRTTLTQMDSDGESDSGSVTRAADSSTEADGGLATTKNPFPASTSSGKPRRPTLSFHHHHRIVPPIQIIPPNLPEIPSIEVVNELLDVFIRNEPHASRIFHIQSLKESIPLHCGGLVDIGSPALLHAICSAASRYLDVDKRRNPVMSAPAAAGGSPSGSNSNGPSPPPTPVAPEIVLPEGFAMFHAMRAKTLITKALEEHQESLYVEQSYIPLLPISPTESDDETVAPKQIIRSARDKKLFQEMIQPLLVLTSYYYHEGRGMEVWANLGALTRTLMSLGLNKPPTEREPTRETALEDEEKKRAFWSTFVLDRIVSAGGWAHSMPEEDSARNFTERDLPLSAKAFRNPFARAEDAPPSVMLDVDSYVLLIDASVLMGRVNDFRARIRLRHRTNAPYPAALPALDAPLATLLAKDPVLRWDFTQLSTALGGGVGYWASNGISGKSVQRGSLPGRFKYPIGMMDTFAEESDAVLAKGRVDTDLFLAHMVHHSATILLHFPAASYTPSPFPIIPPAPIDFPTEESTKQTVPPRRSRSGDSVVVEQSAGACNVDCRLKCLEAARSVVDAAVLMQATKFDITKLHPFVATSWYIAAVVLVHEHHRATEMGDTTNNGIIAKDVQVLRLFLLKYSTRSPIAAQHDAQLAMIIDQLNTLRSDSPDITPFPRNSPPSSKPEPALKGDTLIPLFPFDPATYEILVDGSRPASA